MVFNVAVGTGIKRGNISVDIAYRYGWDHRATTQFLDVDQLVKASTARSRGTERLDMHRVDISLIYQFERQPVERWLRHMFVGD